MVVLTGKVGDHLGEKGLRLQSNGKDFKEPRSFEERYDLFCSQFFFFS